MGLLLGQHRKPLREYSFFYTIMYLTHSAPELSDKQGLHGSVMATSTPQQEYAGHETFGDFGWVGKICQW